MTGRPRAAGREGPGRACSAEEEREKGEREKEREREIRSDDRDGWSHVGDKRPCDAGWDGGEEKERKGSVGGKKNRWTRRMELGVGKTGVRDRKKFPGIRVLGFRRNSSSTMKKKF